MKIIYAGLKWNYGKQEEGYSYEYNNLEEGFRDCAKRGYFDLEVLNPDVLSKQDSRQWLSARILSDSPPDVIFHVAFNDQIDLPHDMLKLAKLRGIKTIQWDCDASWRFFNFILPRKELYTHFVTTHNSTLAWYASNGMNVIQSQWASSPLYSKSDKKMEPKYGVSFIGQKHGVRPQIIQALIASGIDVHLFGHYWEGWPNYHGYLPDIQSVLEVFQSSAINLNLSNPWHIGTMPQIKGRHFEIPAAGGFQLSTPADNLETYFKDGKEIVIARSAEELCEKIEYYLGHEDERISIAESGFGRSQAEHQWHHRIPSILQEAVGLV